MTWWWVVAAAVGYLLGSIIPAALIARVRRIDLRGSGSGNPGATNAARVMGIRIGVVVGVFDVLKGLVPALAFTIWGDPSLGEVAGFAAVIGHITSPWLGFRGGKGVATTIGVILGTHLLWAVPVLIVFGLMVWRTKRMGLSACLGALMLIPASLIFPHDGGDVVFAVLLAGLVLVRHYRNLRDFWLEIRAPKSA
jgi:glycerol-3-phosphate acyltransferase PlsY